MADITSRENALYFVVHSGSSFHLLIITIHVLLINKYDTLHFET